MKQALVIFLLVPIGPEIYCQNPKADFDKLYMDHKFFRGVTKCKYDDSPDKNDLSAGIFHLGKSSRNTFGKIYSKTKEISDK
jgi:hypothetical protein